MTGDPRSLVTENVGPIAIIRFNRPAERNPLSIAVLENLADKLTALLPRKDIQSIIFTGTDDVFASGANIRELINLDSVSARSFAKFGQDLFGTIASAKQVTIAAVNGYCMGGALDLALACDIRLSSTNAVFAHPGARLGIITGWGGTQRLPRLIGRARSLEFFMTARLVTSDEALRIGLVTRVCDPVLECAIKIASSVQKESGRRAKARRPESP